MRELLVSLTLFAILLTACGASQPGKPAPSVLGTEAPAMPHY